jgi:hypothetical protein
VTEWFGLAERPAILRVAALALFGAGLIGATFVRGDVGGMLVGLATTLPATYYVGWTDRR